MTDDPFADKWVRITVYSDEPIACNSKRQKFPVERLPISEGLLGMFRAWEAWHTESEDEWKEPPSAFDWSNFGIVGMALTRAMKWELGDDWQVFFFEDQVLHPEHYVWDSVMRQTTDEETPDWLLKLDAASKLGPGSSPG